MTNSTHTIWQLVHTLYDNQYTQYMTISTHNIWQLVHTLYDN